MLRQPYIRHPLERHLERIANALENLLIVQSLGPLPRCEGCDHLHVPAASCLAEGCDCKYAED